MNFIVRTVSSLGRKAMASWEQALAGTRARSPFLPPYNEYLFVGYISETHVGILNRFNVVDHHLLIATREFEEQETLLTQSDFEALWAVLAEIDGLAFYNGGSEAGASQTHKHLQAVPLPLAPEEPGLPVEPLLLRADLEGVITSLPGLPFRHAAASVRPQWFVSPGDDGAEALLSLYHLLLRAAGLVGEERIGEERIRDKQRQHGPYNLLVTRRWMLLVPRSREHFGPISINSLGFAGALLASNQEELELLRRHGPMAALSAVAVN